MADERDDRALAILTRLSEAGSVTVAELAEQLDVSVVTVRADLKSLEEQGMLARTRGGAKPLAYKTVFQRERVNVEAKRRIATEAASLVRDNDAVFIEAGTTVAMIARYLTGRRGVQIVTNSTLVFNNARANPALNIILTGGVFRRESESLVGPTAERAVGEFNTRIAFLGTDGFTPERGLTTGFVEGAQVAALMHRRSEETWLVADSSKFGQAGFVSSLALADLTGIITDSGLPDDAVAALGEHTHVRVV